MQHVYPRRKRDTIVRDYSFGEEFSKPPAEDTLLQYFLMFITATLLDVVVEQTNIYSFQAKHKSIDTNRAEILSLIGMMIKMGISHLPSYKSYWGREFRFPAIADVMSRNRYQELIRYFAFCK